MTNPQYPLIVFPEGETNFQQISINVPNIKYMEVRVAFSAEWENTIVFYSSDGKYNVRMSTCNGNSHLFNSEQNLTGGYNLFVFSAMHKVINCSHPEAGHYPHERSWGKLLLYRTNLDETTSIQIGFSDQFIPSMSYNNLILDATIY